MTDKLFTIIVVDDHHDDLDRYFDEIEDYLENKGFSLKVLPSKKGEEVNEYLSENTVDIILTDKNLGGGKTGDMLIEEIRENHFLTDILYYSGASINETDYVNLGKYISVEIIRSKEFVSTLKKMIEKNLRKWDDVVFLRGLIISNAVEVETKLNEFFTKYFQVAKSKLEHFDLILEGTAISLQGKKDAMVKIINNENWDEFKILDKHIQYVQKERNILAHSKLEPMSKSFISKGKSHKYDKTKMLEILHTADLAVKNLEKLIQKLG